MINVLGLGAVGSFGTGIKSFSEALCQPEKYATIHHVPEYQEDIRVHLAETEELAKYLTKAKQRRMDHFSRMFYLGAMDALSDSGLAVENLDQQKVGVICATAYGASKSSYAFKDSINSKADQFASPLHFSKSVSNSAIANFMLNMKLHGPNLTICQPNNPLESALTVASLWLNQRYCDIVIVVALDELSDPLAYSYKRLEETGQEKLICGDAENVELGEGCSVFVLGSSEIKSAEKYDHISWPDLCNKLENMKLPSAQFGVFPTAKGFDLLLNYSQQNQ